MSTFVEKRLKNLGLELPEPSSAVANYLPYTISGNHVIVSGQLPIFKKEVQFKGKVGQDLSIETGQEAARLCAMNILAQLKVACDGELDRVKECLRIGGFVNCLPDFMDHPKVINGASDLMVAVFGDAGRHARVAVGVNSLPFGAAVEIEAMFRIL